MDIKYQKPFLKWVGGKTQIIDNIVAFIPKEINNYHEPFLGGGSVLFAVLTLQKHEKIIIKNKIYACDSNKRLINLYKHIQQTPDELYNILQSYFKIYDSLTGTLVNKKPNNIEEAKTSKESYYYFIRNKFNNIDVNTLESSALFLFINKLCFRGMYREGPNGYNVPFGHYKTYKNITRDELKNISLLIKNVEFIHCDFQESIKRALDKDFIYLDPPYVPEKSKSFVEYTNDKFSKETHEALFALIKQLPCKFVLSNSKVELVIKTFSNYNVTDILVRRAINSKNPGLTTKEVIIKN
jgi:DNA adenine methylase